jgi:hypothetical protein
MATANGYIPGDVLLSSLPSVADNDRGHHTGLDGSSSTLGDGETRLYSFRGIDTGFPGPGVYYVAWRGATTSTPPPAPPFGGPVTNIVYRRVK